MTINEEQLSMALHDLVDQEGSAITSAEQVLNRASRAKRGRTALVTTAALGILGVTAAAVVGVGGLAPGGAGQGRVGDTSVGTEARAGTPALRLAAAAQATVQTSFAFTATVRDEEVVLSNNINRHISRSFGYTGAFDPRGPKGYLQNVKGPGIDDQRLIGGVLYRQMKGGWSKGHQSKVDAFLMDGGLPDTLNPTSTVDFMAQMNTIKDQGTVTSLGTSGSGDAAVERYSFSFTAYPTDGDKPQSILVSGTIEVGVKSGMIGKISYESTLNWPSGIAKDHYAAEWVYTNYGMDVKVEIPTGLVH
jgi:hypothetical protein